MNYEELLKIYGCYISFESIQEPRTNEVKLRIIVNKSNNPTDLLIFPHPDSKVEALQIDFENYVTYSVIYDDFTNWNANEVFRGEIFRIYDKSDFLNSIQRELGSSLLSEKTHYSLACIEHRVDIISKHQPKITQIELDS
ncbi:hypothetical protein D3H55_15445 [Bacillus salacetis]|uniref:Uncharacterized protein n=1 Tax=Bacillus salacetis TaxID=2315464 RepID=A0A3A1QVE9_9BACI|nr:hypothetical protein [Bacillus salacetis]RIW31365.1 hypothetical protein D3H55_15445 [Bacillus salacetis]